MVIFHKSVNPKKLDIIISIVQMVLIWGFTFAWAVFGLVNLNRQAWETCDEPDLDDIKKIASILLIIDFLVIFFCSLIAP